MVGFAGAGPFFTYPNDLLTFVGGIWNTNSIVKKDPHLWCLISSVASILNTNSHVTKDLDPWRQDLLLSPPATRTATKEEQPQSTSNNTTTISRTQHKLPRDLFCNFAWRCLGDHEPKIFPNWRFRYPKWTCSALPPSHSVIFRHFHFNNEFLHIKIRRSLLPKKVRSLQR